MYYVEWVKKGFPVTYNFPDEVEIRRQGETIKINPALASDKELKRLIHERGTIYALHNGTYPEPEKIQRHLK